MQNIYQDLLLLAVGFLSGFMNTVASSGTAVTLPAMIFMGMPPAVANATNRLPLLIGFVIAVANFQKAGAIPWKRALLNTIPIIIGTVAGVFFVSRLSADAIHQILIIALCISFGMIILSPRKFLAKRSGQGRDLTLLSYLLMFGIGLWAGLIVLDMGTLMLFALVFNQGLDIVKANAIKAVLALAVGITSSLIFAWHGSIDFNAGIILSIGSIGGSYWGSKFAIREESRKWIYRIIMFIIGLEIIRLSIEKLFQ